ncbi:MAG: c-type cytochrome [Limisphaerales bacterium]
MNAPETKPVLPEAEPKAGSATMPIWLIVALLVIFFYGGLYFDARGGWFNARLYAPYRNLAQLEQFQPKADDGGVARGRVVYEQLCAVCHGSDGAGKPGQAPPFAGSEWVITDSVGRLIRIPLQGLVGPITVKGVEWNMAMPAMGASLNDEDLAALLTYMRNSWGNKASIITPEMVKQVRADTASRTQPWTAAELLKIP